MSNTSIEDRIACGLALDLEAEADRIGASIRGLLRNKIRRRGLVVAVSGGIDSSVCLALAVRALGPKKVFALLLPETDSASSSTERGLELVKHLGVSYKKQDIAATLEAIGCYQWRDAAMRELFPGYSSEWKSKIIISGGLSGGINHFLLVVEDPSGETSQKRLGIKQYLQIVAATNFKQRIRKNLEYFHADRLNYAVVGTPNLLEYDQGFFVKNGDGAADLKPIAHLFKTQVYAMARHLGLPERICNATPTTDTYSLEQGQDEFYFALPYAQMDIALWCLNQGISASDLAAHLQIEEQQAAAIYRDIEAKRATTAYMHAPAYLIAESD